MYLESLSTFDAGSNDEPEVSPVSEPSKDGSPFIELWAGLWVTHLRTQTRSDGGGESTTIHCEDVGSGNTNLQSQAT